jgi:translocation and assembly module TamB
VSMKRKLRLFGNIAGAVIVLTMLAVLTVLTTIQSQWFEDRIRERIISEVQDATGGRVELDRFSFNWHTLTATFDGFVLHGSESASSPPLFRASSVVIRLRVISALERKVTASSIVVQHPDIHVAVRADGSTNIPSPRSGSNNATAFVEEMLNLKLRHCELNHGSLQVDMHVVPLNVRSGDTHILLTYNGRNSEYLLTISSQDVDLHGPVTPLVATRVYASARIRRDGVTLESGELATAASTLHASGSIRDFLRPAFDLNVTADIDAAEFGRQVGFTTFHNGRVVVAGVLHGDETVPVQFSGDLSAQDLAFEIGTYVLKRCSLSSRIFASPYTALLSKFKLLTPLAQLSGDATIHDRDASVTGHISGLQVRSAARILWHRDVPWTGDASGRVTINGTLGKLSTLVVETKLDITPEPGAPISGHIEAAYRQPGHSLEIAKAELNLPHTQAAFSGHVNDVIQVAIDTSDTNDLRSFISAPLPAFAPGGNAHFKGSVTGPLDDAVFDGELAVNHFVTAGITWDRLRTRARLSSASANLTEMSLQGTAADLSGDAQLPLARWALNPEAAASMSLQVHRADLNGFGRLFPLDKFRLSGGLLAGVLNFNGPLNDPRGSAHLTLRQGVVYYQQIDRAAADIELNPGELRILHGSAAAGSATLAFSGAYAHAHSSWSTGELRIKADSNAFRLRTLAVARQYEPSWDAQVELHAEAGIAINQRRIEPAATNGTLMLRNITEDNQQRGDATVNVSTRAGFLYAGFSGDLGPSHWKANAEIQLIPGAPVSGRLQIDNAELRTLCALVSSHAAELTLNGSFQAAASFKGLLGRPESIQTSIQIDGLEVSGGKQGTASPNAHSLMFRNSAPILLEVADGRLAVRNFQLSGPDTNLAISGSVGLLQQKTLELRAEGAADLKLVRLVQPALQTAGRALISASIAGTAAAPAVTGSLQIQNGSLLATGFSNELTNVNGVVRFNRGRATIEKLIAQTGGGTLSFGGFVDFPNGSPPVYRLDATVENVRVRYANTISVTGNSQLRFAGTSKNGVLSGSATLSRVVFTPNADVGMLLASSFASATSAAPENDLLTGLQLDLRIASAPDLQVATQLSRDLQAEIDLRLRGTPQHPLLLGDIVANQGDIRIFGGKYSINHAEVSFVNAARIIPVVDLDLQTVVRGITVDVSMAGTPGKLNINYRSDPPLQPRDIIALLTVGRVPQTGTVNPNFETASNTGTAQLSPNNVLGQAISPAPGTLQKLFGVTNVRIDPSLVQTITSVPQARLTVEQQISREITVTYVTNLSQTSEQIFRVEWAFARQYSVVALRDDNGEFGIDIQYRKSFK